MGKEIVMSTVFPGLTVKEQHQLCSGPDNMINYHKTVHNNDKIQVSPWQPEYFDPSDMQPSSSRSVTMYQTFEAPAWVRRAAGFEYIKMDDVHVASFDRETGNIRQTSSPVITIPTLGEVSLTSMVWEFNNIVQDGQPCVQVNVRISADADNLKWLKAVRSVLEKIFVSESIKSVEGFFKQTGDRLAEYVRLRDEGNPPPFTAPWPLDPPEVFAEYLAATGVPGGPAASHQAGGDAVLDSLDLEYFSAHEDSDGEEEHSPPSQAGSPHLPPQDPVRSKMGDRTPITEKGAASAKLVLVNTLPSERKTGTAKASTPLKERSKAAMKKLMSAVKPKAKARAAA